MLLSLDGPKDTVNFDASFQQTVVDCYKFRSQLLKFLHTVVPELVLARLAHCRSSDEGLLLLQATWLSLTKMKIDETRLLRTTNADLVVAAQTQEHSDMSFARLRKAFASVRLRVHRISVF
eukprot:1472579-Amphidinium_carterae.1